MTKRLPDSMDLWTIGAAVGLEAAFEIVQSTINWLGAGQMIDLMIPMQAVIFLILGVTGLPLIVLARLLPLLVHGQPTIAVGVDLAAVLLAATLPCLAACEMFGMAQLLAGLRRVHIVAILVTNAVTYWSVSMLMQGRLPTGGVHSASSAFVAPLVGGLLLLAGAVAAVKARPRLTGARRP